MLHRDRTPNVSPLNFEGGKLTYPTMPPAQEDVIEAVLKIWDNLGQDKHQFWISLCEGFRRIAS